MQIEVFFLPNIRLPYLSRPSPHHPPPPPSSPPSKNRLIKFFWDLTVYCKLKTRLNINKCLLFIINLPPKSSDLLKQDSSNFSSHRAIFLVKSERLFMFFRIFPYFPYFGNFYVSWFLGKLEKVKLGFWFFVLRYL